jgi:hypothetical protein
MRERQNIYCHVTEIKETGLDMKLQWGVNRNRIFVEEPTNKWILGRRED